MMNRTLYALTLVTFLSTPIALLTGTFGMNFADMRELVNLQAPSALATFLSSSLLLLSPPLSWLSTFLPSPLFLCSLTPAQENSHTDSHLAFEFNTTW
jgi:hypothetical protein